MLTANSPNALDMLLPKAKGKSTNTQNVSVSINKNLEYFVNNQQINGAYIEIELKKALEGKENPTVILRAEESVAIKEAVNVMDIANKNNYKVILAVRPN
jgi:biopolymer transport protein ExbD